MAEGEVELPVISTDPALPWWTCLFFFSLDQSIALAFKSDFTYM